GHRDICNGDDGATGREPAQAPAGQPGEDGRDGMLMLVAVSEEAPGKNCEHGGQLVEIGPDLDQDGSIDTEVARESHYVCDGVAGQSGDSGVGSLVVSGEEGPGDKCAYGGQRVVYGVDANTNGILDEGEVAQVRYVCRGAPGVTPAVPLFTVTPVAAGELCGAGGERIESGLDLDHNNALDPAEITTTRYVCTRSPGAPARVSLVNVATEPAGVRCAGGGRRVDVGLDQNADHILQDAEILNTQYVCAGAPGAQGTAGQSALVPTVIKSPEAAGTHCANGGQRIEIGFDADASGGLTGSEITQTEYVCDGGSGDPGEPGRLAVLAVVKTGSELPGENCPAGGQSIQSGLDSNSNGMLDAGEVTRTDFVCYGSSALDGSNGVNALLGLTSVTEEPAGTNCTAGGQAVSFGLDDDEDGTLDAEEIEGTRYICNGVAGTNGTVGAAGTDARRTLVTVAAEPASPNCLFGGNRISYGLDDNSDSVLAPGEIDATRYVCNGAPGTNGTNGTSAGNAVNSLVKLSAEASGVNCTGGGRRIDAGLDSNASGVLDATEIQSTSYVCDYDPFINGSFELANFQGWTVTGGIWGLVTEGTTLNQGSSILNYVTQQNSQLTSEALPYTADATDGTRVAVNYQTGVANSHLIQDFNVPSGVTSLKWDMRYINTFGTFNATRQYIAVYVRSPKTNTVLQQLYKTTSEAASQSAMITKTVDISAFRGMQIRLDFEIQVRDNWLDFAIDNVRMQ
ncbi:MAG TPA: hypothetical protein VFQ61_30340, partial [Polyangiaceae bacterium]|nr:hypothetical protein [Polyangiaceae bacterium]